MAIQFELDDLVFASALAVILALPGFFLGLILEVVAVAASAFAPATGTVATAVATLASNAGLFPLVFTLLFVVGGFLYGLYYHAQNTPP